MKTIGIYLGENSSAGGMYQYSLSLLTALGNINNKKYRIIIIASDKEWLNVLKNYSFKTYFSVSLLSKLIPKLLVATFIPVKFGIFLSRLFNPVVRQIYRLKLDLIIFPNQDHLTFQVNIRSLSTIHDLMHLYEGHFPEVSQGLRYWYRQYRFKNISNFSNGILVDSLLGMEHVIESYNVRSKKIFVLPYIPPKYIYEKSAFIDKTMPDKFLFYPAQFWEHKNHEKLFRAIAKVKNEHQDLRLVLTGRNNHLYSKLVKLTKELDINDNVIFLGKVEDSKMSFYYKNARALIYPSFFGPTNIPPLEAVICECPVAVSDIYAMREQLGDAAIYFDPRSVYSISTIIKKLWTDDRTCKSLILKGKELAGSFSEDIFSNRFDGIIEKVLNDL